MCSRTTSLHGCIAKTCTARILTTNRYFESVDVGYIQAVTQLWPSKIFAQVKKLHAAIAYKHKRMLEQQKSDRDTTIGVALGVGLGIAAVGLGFLLAGGKRGNK